MKMKEEGVRRKNDFLLAAIKAKRKENIEKFIYPLANIIIIEK